MNKAFLRKKACWVRHWQYALLPVFLLLYGQAGKAQITSYSRTVLSGQTYTQIATGTTISSNAQLTPGMSTNADDGAVLVTLPFTFTYDGLTFTQATFCTNGWVGMGNQMSMSAADSRGAGNLFSTTAPKNTLAAWFGDMSGNFPTGSGRMVHGSVGTDVYAFEWRNATGSGFGQTTTNLINFMVKIYGPASTNPGRIEFLYGTQAGSLSTGRSIGIEDNIGGPNRFINALNGSFTSTTTASAWQGNGNGYRFDPPPPCTGTPGTPTVAPAGPLSLCVGSQQTLTATATPIASGYAYQWESAPIGGVFTPIAGATAPTYTFTAFASREYRVKVTCISTAQSTNSAATVVNVTSLPTYATLPVVESFESWMNRCSTNDVPGNSWVAEPASGNNSWRRHDQGSSASWGSLGSGLYNPVSINGSYSARFHTFSASSGTRGRLYLFVDCSTVTGNKELQFYSINTSGSDSLIVSMSTDGGATFTQLGGYTTFPSWTLNTLPVISNSATTVFRFDARSDFGVTDIGLDYVRVLPPCSGKPVAGTVSNAQPCPSANFTLNTIGTTQAAGLTYQWQQSANGTTWANSAGGTNAILTTSITAPTYFRCIVTCTNGSQADTTPSKLINLASFYVCYCNNTATSTADDDIGNVTIRTQPANVTLLNNGTATPVTSNSSSVNMYTNFTSIAPIKLYRDSLYLGLVSQINSGSFAYSCGIAIFIDYNQNGVFDATEKVLNRVTTGTSAPPNPNQVSDTFRIPTNAGLGITGMRVVMIEGNTSPGPCGTYTWGETEDYLVEINYPPCDGPTNPGFVNISDSTMCVGYDIVLIDTTHEYKRSGIVWDWQTSTDGGINWSSMAGTQGKDTVIHTVAGPAAFRLRMICTITGDTTYSNVVNVTINQPWQCYCYSIATGKDKDTTDVGAFAIGNFMMPLTNIGPHLLNPAARRDRTDFTDVNGLQLWADTTYQVDIFQTMPTGIHADARITMFIDYNNNLQYDIPAERVLTVITSPTNWYTVSHITIPNAVIPNVPTGLRVIINNNVSPNSPSDDACGAYMSGETEDYVVTLRRGVPAGVGNVGVIRDLSLYPNPTEGRFTVQFNMAQQVKDLKVVVTNLTGQQVAVKHFDHPSRQFRTEMDLASQPRGVYLVEVHADGSKMVRKLIVR